MDQTRKEQKRSTPVHKETTPNVLTTAEQGAAPDRLQLRSFLAALPAAGELGGSPACAQL